MVSPETAVTCCGERSHAKRGCGRLESRPLSAAYLAKKLPLADKVIRSLEKRGFIFPEQIHEDRDPLRAPSDRLLVELAAEQAGSGRSGLR